MSDRRRRRKAKREADLKVIGEIDNIILEFDELIKETMALITPSCSNRINAYYRDRVEEYGCSDDKQKWVLLQTRYEDYHD